MKDIDLKKKIASSTFLHQYVDSAESLIKWGLLKVGGGAEEDGGLITAELTEEMCLVCVADALEKYTKYASFDIQDIIVDISNYEHGRGVNLSAYNIADIHDISFQRDALLYGFGNDMFFGMGALLQSYAGGGIFPYFNSIGTSTGSWIGLHNLHENFDLINRMTGSGPQYRYFKSSKYLVITPEPKLRPDSPNNILITCEVEPPPEELYGNEYVKRLFLAYLKIQLGTVRKKYQGVALPGGGTLDTSIGDEGKEELDKALEELRSSESFGNICMMG